MTRVGRRRLVLAAVALLVGVVALRVPAQVTAAAWTDTAVFAASATAGGWPAGRCEIVSTVSQEAVGTCDVAAVRVVHEWGDVGPDGRVQNGGMIFDVDVDGYQGAAGTQARVTVDLSRVTGTTRSWPWSDGAVSLFNGVVDAWDAPEVTFTAYEWNPSPFRGQFVVSA